MNWIVEEAQSADPRKDRVILENPATVRELDELLIKKYYPSLRSLSDFGCRFVGFLLKGILVTVSMV